MTNVTPTNQTANPPGLEQVLLQHRIEIMKVMNCARPGTIKDFDAADQTATVTIAQKQVTSVDPNGVQTFADFPPIQKVPVIFFSAGGFTVTAPVVPGDEGLLIFLDRQLDNWFFAAGTQPPTVPRLHDMSDAVMILGLRRSTRSLANFSTTALQVRSDDYTGIEGAGECVELSPGKISLVADEVNVHGRTKATFDAGGTGFVYTPDKIDTYTDGVPTDHHNPNPPQVPT